MDSDIQVFKDGGQEDVETHIHKSNLAEQSKKARLLFQSIQDELLENDDIKEGLSFLDLKNDTLLSYMIDLTNILLHKAKGDSIEGNQSIDRTIEYRLILEKVKNIDQRMAYQLNKLVSLPDEKEERVDINNLDVAIDDDDDDDDDDDEDGDEDEDEERSGEEETEGDDDDGDEDDDNDAGEDLSPRDKKQKQTQRINIYKPPKLRAVRYDEERPRRADKTDEPALDEEKKRRYEESNYTRIRESKKRKKIVRRGKGSKRR